MIGLLPVSTAKSSKIVAVSLYANPLHQGHLDLLYKASEYGLVYAIVNNDKQVALKKSIPFLPEATRLSIVKALKPVYSAKLAIDEDGSVAETIKYLKPHIFLNGGDRLPGNLNEKELQVCREIECDYVCWVSDKIDSSSTIIENAVKWYQENRQ